MFGASLYPAPCHEKEVHQGDTSYGSKKYLRGRKHASVLSSQLHRWLKSREEFTSQRKCKDLPHYDE